MATTSSSYAVEGKLAQAIRADWAECMRLVRELDRESARLEKEGQYDAADDAYQLSRDVGERAHRCWGAMVRRYGVYVG